MNVLLRKKPVVRRGASRARVKPSREPFQFRRLLPLLLLPLLLLAISGAYQGVSLVADMPVTRVMMTGEFRHVDREQLADSIQPLLQQGFVGIDLDEVASTLQRSPWVYEARLERQWPSELHITVVEQMPIAYWGDQSLLNHRAHLFPQSDQRLSVALPKLFGPDGSEQRVMKQFHRLADVLRDNGLVLVQLRLDQRGSWEASLASGVELVLGQEPLMGKVQRFVAIYQQGLVKDFSRAKRVDMRYSSGLAVQWRADNESNG